MLVTTKWLSVQSWMLASTLSRTAKYGPPAKSGRTRVLAQKHSRLAMSRASATPLRMVRFGVMTRMRPSAMPNGSVAMMPVLPHPTGICTIAGPGPSAKCSRTCAVRLALWFAQEVVGLDVRVGRAEQGPGVLGFGTAVFEPERLEVGAAVLAVAVARLAHRRELALGIPTAQSLGGDADVLGRLADAKVVV